MNTSKKSELLQNRRWRIRKKIVGSQERPRLSLRLSGKHIYAQCVDDDAGKTLVFLSSLAPELRSQKITANLKGAETVAKVFAEKVKSSGITRVVFDRGGRRYHGCVKKFADTVRAGGIQF